jgi:pimeloyl-ACP methyl ester carboxylesterase
MLEDRMALKNDSIAYSRYIDYVLSSINSMLEEPVYEDLSKLNAPSLVLFGADDQLIPNRILHPGLTVNEVLDKSEKIQSSKRILINEAGHFIQWDQAQEVARQINEFIANLLTKK